MNYFHFSIGPVQEFVNQARRTSDFWAGSFLLSWLAGVAMCAVQRQGGVLEFPLPPKNYLDWIEGKLTPANGEVMARIGAVPNRFSATVPAKVGTNEAANFDGQHITDCVREAWIALANHTLQADGLNLTPEGRLIWQRQIAATSGGLWDMHWVLLEADQPSTGFATDFTTHGNAHHRLLDARKHWRNHYPDKEPGRKCSLMHGWQELSGAAYDAVEAYWQTEREAYQQRNQREGKLLDKMLDINEREHLCALAYVKRRFVQHFANFKLTSSALGQTLRGWNLPPNVPSTQYLAAAPWLSRVLADKHTQPEQIRNFEDAAHASGVNDGEARTNLRCVREAALAYARNAQSLPILHTLDGVAFFEDEIRRQTASESDPKPAPDALRNTKPLLKALKCLQQQHGSAAKYYALLLMDGDRIGDILDQYPQELAQALQAFTDGVADIVQHHSGFLVYAGGDDVLALLPMDQALACALALRQWYLACFAPYPAILHPSLSAAIEFAHFKTPLTQITNDAHALLDDIAKQAHGRDSLAVRVWKGSGIHLTWCQPWQIALAKSDAADAHEVASGDASNDAGKSASGEQLALHAVLAQIQARPTLFSSGFFFRANEVYAAMHGMDDSAAVKELIVYEYGHSLAAKQHAATRADIETLLNPLYRQSIPHRRCASADGKSYHHLPDPDPQADCALLIRFLWQQGFEGSIEGQNPEPQP